VRLLVADIALLPDVGDAITQLSFENHWVEVGDPVEDILTAVFETVTDYYNDMLVGLVSQFLASIPPGWLQLDGATHLKDDYPLLWERLPSQLRTASDFTLPDLTDVFINGAMDTSEIGDQGGSSSYSLSIDQLAAHTHNYIPSPLGITPGMAGPAAPASIPGAPIPTTSAGSGASIDNRPAYVEMLFAVYAGQE
jgi:microcystin-dependent protein